jgi:hypothetical protein
MSLRPDPADVGARLELLRHALGHRKQTTMVAFLGPPITPQHWNNWKQGKAVPSAPQARHIAMKTRVTMDWIYWGDRAGLPVNVAELLDRAA